MSTHPAFAAVMAAVLSLGCTKAVEEPQFQIRTKRDNDRVEVKVERGMTVFSVHSPFGISQADIERNDENWPDTVMLRLHLKGLENFKVSNGKVTLEAVGSSQDGKVRLWKDGEEDAPLDAESPYWMEIRRVGDDGKLATTIPLTDDCFEIQLPKALFEDNPKLISVNWINFYR
jgi:hypothetical protein